MPKLQAQSLGFVDSILNNNKDIKLNPNSVSSIVNIEVEEQFVGEKLDIYTIVGQLIGSHKITQTHYSIDVSALSEGTYIVRISGQPETEKLVKINIEK